MKKKRDVLNYCLYTVTPRNIYTKRLMNECLLFSSLYKYTIYDLRASSLSPSAGRIVFNIVFEFEDLHLAVGSHGHVGPVVVERHLQHSSGAFVGVDQLARFQGPEVDVAIVAGGGHVVAVGADADLVQLIAVILEGVDAVPGLGVPNSHGAVRGAGGQQVRVGHPEQAPHVTKVTLEGLDGGGALQTPQLDGEVHRAGGELLGTCRVLRHFVNAAGMTAELMLRQIDRDVKMHLELKNIVRYNVKFSTAKKSLTGRNCESSTVSRVMIPLISANKNCFSLIHSTSVGTVDSQAVLIHVFNFL